MIFIDDLGMKASCDQAALKLLEEHEIFGFSCMAGYTENLRILERNLNGLPEVKLGLHLDLFFQMEHPLKLIESQWDNFCQIFQREPDYIDGHMHAHQFFPFSYFIKRSDQFSSIPFRRTFFVSFEDLSLKSKIKGQLSNFFFSTLPSDNLLNDNYLSMYRYDRLKEFEYLLKEYLEGDRTRNAFSVHPDMEEGSWRHREFLSFRKLMPRRI